MSTDLYITTDLGCAAFPFALGHEPNISDAAPGRKQFQFPSEAAADAAGFYGNAPIPARLYFAALRDLKAMLYLPAPRRTNSNRNEAPTHANPTHNR